MSAAGAGAGAAKKTAKVAAVQRRMGAEEPNAAELMQSAINSPLGEHWKNHTTAGKVLKRAGDDETSQAVMAGAAQGAAESAIASGGAAVLGGAIWGGIKGLAKTKKGRAIIAIACLLALVPPMIVVVAINQVTSAAASSFLSAREQSQATAAVAAGFTQAQIDAAMAAVDGTDVPWTIAVVWQGVTGQAFTSGTASKLSQAVDKANSADIDLDPSDLADISDSGGMTIPASAQAAETRLEVVWVSAMTLIGLTKDQATAVFERAVAISTGQNNSCSTADDSGTTGGATQLSAVQTKNAETIIGVVKSAVSGSTAVQQHAARIALSTAEQESSLEMYANDGSDTADIGKSGLTSAALATAKTSLTYAHDAVGHNFDSVGLFQQRPGSGWGTVSQLMTASYDAEAFLGGSAGPNHGSPRGLLDVSGWQSMSVTDAAQAVQGSADPTAYAKWATESTQIIAALWSSSPAISTGTSSSAQAAGNLDLCGGGSSSISADQKQLAQQIVQFEKAGLVTYWNNPDYKPIDKQIDNIANGTATADCNIHAGVLQIIVFAVQEFGAAQINDLNRTCSGNPTDKGISAHFTGDAVDFGALGNQVLQPGKPLKLMTLVGWDANSAALVRLLDPHMPKTGEAGQEQCRADPAANGAPAGTAPDSVVTKNIHQFYDACSHAHLDLGLNSNATLSFGTSA